MTPPNAEVWTSETHPLRIAELEAPGGGKIGVTFCPGKHQAEAASGCWRRDLSSDLDAIEKWGAKAVVTLVEAHELDSLNVPALGSQVRARGIAWLHLPIVDNWIPDAAFEASWKAEARRLHAILDRGGRVLVHCKGGLGRAGTIAARLLIERGSAAREAITAVRRVRLGAIENRTQENYLRELRQGSAMVDLALADRVEGCLLAGACGDALGAPVEFMRLPEIQRRYGHGGIRDFAPVYGRTGAITDDTQMALFTLEGLLRAHVGRHERGNGDVVSRVHAAYKRWLRTQIEPYPAFFEDEDGWLIRHRNLWSARAPGNTCMAALSLHLPDGTPARNESKGCGSVMRVAPVGLLFADPFDLGGKLAALTHGHPTSTHSSAAFAAIIAAIVHEAMNLRSAVEHARRLLEAEQDAGETLAAIDLACDLAETRDASGIPYELGPRASGGGWVAEEALAIALYCCLAEPDPLSALQRSVNHDGDTDSTGAIAGNLLGAMHGMTWLPGHWLETLELADAIRTMASDTIEALRDGSSAVEDLRARYPAV